jgi:sulfoxide reductase heme-binding subunit YedZ
MAGASGRGDRALSLLAAAGPSPLWYLSRGTGAVALLLLTISVVLGILDQRRWRPPRTPRFVLDALHRNVSLLVLALLAVHIASSVIDSYASIRLVDVFVPFVSAYRPLWLGLGALAFDLLLAILVTSVLRRYIGHSTWRAVHWLAYLVWPVALVHGLATGTDVKAGWLVALSAACGAAVLIAAWMRVIAASETQGGRRTAALATLVVAPIALLVWLPQGPLARGWARRAGTPAALLGGGRAVPVAARPPALPATFVSTLTGTVRRAESASGLASVELSMRFRGEAAGAADVLLEGQALPGGGIQMTRSRVTFGSQAHPSEYRGRVTSLDGNRIVAHVGAAGGQTRRLGLAVTIAADSTVSGTLVSRPAESNG